MSEDDDKDFKAVLSKLDIDKEELEKKSLISIAKQAGLNEKVTQVNSLSFSYRMILEGKTFFEEDGGFKQTGKAIAGRKFISLSYSVLNSFSDESNLITTKDFDKFAVQFIDAFEKVNNLILRDRSISEKDYRVIIKLFKDKLMNIGDIITGSDGNMEKVFNNRYDDPDISYNDKLNRGA